jgi:NADPH:quinone reductase-like Zn-dependent oxidoreductase
MRAMVLHAAGAAFELQERPIPKPGRDEALTRIRACEAEQAYELVAQGAMIGRAALVMQGP